MVANATTLPSDKSQLEEEEEEEMESRQVVCNNAEVEAVCGSDGELVTVFDGDDEAVVVGKLHFSVEPQPNPDLRRLLEGRKRRCIGVVEGEEGVFIWIAFVVSRKVSQISIVIVHDNVL